MCYVSLAGRACRLNVLRSSVARSAAPQRKMFKHLGLQGNGATDAGGSTNDGPRSEGQAA